MNHLTVLLLLVCCLQERAAADPRPEDLQQAVNNWRAQQIGGAVSAAVVTPVSTQFFHAGDLRPVSPAPPNERTMYEIGSITKGFTGQLLADQVISGKVLLNDTLEKLLTDWSGYGRYLSTARRVTLLELATHSSGIPWLPENLGSDYHTIFATYGTKQLYPWLNSVKLSSPGTYAYSNVGFGILGHALAVTAGKSYEALLRERVLDPLGLRDTVITLNSDQAIRIAPGHDASGGWVPNWNFDVIGPGGALRSTVSDLAKFMRFATGIDTSEISPLLALKLASHKWGNGGASHLKTGLGWMRSLADCSLIVWHNGKTGGYYSYMAWYPDKQIGVAVLASVINDQNPPETLGLKLLQQLRQTY